MLDQHKLPAFLEQYFAGTKPNRLVGRELTYDSGYFDISRFFGNQATDPKTITIRYLPDIYQLKDERIAKFSSFIETELRRQGRLTMGPPAMKMAAIELNGEKPTMTVQPADYADFAGSCFALDYEHPLFKDWGGTLRDYYKAVMSSNAVEDNPLAICLGISGMVVTQAADEIFILRMRRARHLATMTGSYGSSVAGVVDYVTTYQNLMELMVSALSQELQEEIGLTSYEYRIVPLAYTREILRGEHPQLFCLVTTNLSRQEISARLNRLDEAAREFDRFDFIKLDDDRRADRDDIESLNSEGRINYYLVEEYLSNR